MGRMVGHKLHQLGQRFLRAFTPVALSVSLAAAGCETAPEPEAAELGIELRASKDGPSQEIVENGKKIAHDIVADEAFAELIQVSAEVVGDLHQVQQKLTDEELESIAITTTEPYFPEVMGPGALLQHLGGDAEHLQQIGLLVNELRENHDLQKASPEDIRYVFELAFDTEEADEMVEEAVVDEVGVSLYDPCEQACHNAYVAIAIVAIAAFAIAMAVAVVTFPFGLILASIAISLLNRTLAQAQAERDICIAACDGIVLDLDLCGDTQICSEDEYCWKGPFGIGADECRPKKAEGKTCSTHDHCDSGCCKLHVWSNPVSKTCRPANKCN